MRAFSARVVLAVLVVLAFRIATPTIHAGSALSERRVLTASIPAALLTHIDLTALDGSVDLRVDADPTAQSINVAVALEPPRLRNFRLPASADLTQVALDTTTLANVVRIGLRNAAAGNVEATWTITVPARFSVRIDAHDGSVHVTGVQGGVEALVNAGLGGRRGDLVVDVPRGRLDLSIGVGHITATRGSTQFDRAEVRATVGDAQLYLLGHEIVAPHEPGPGHRVKLDGKGPDWLSLRATVGDVALRIG